MKQRVTLTIQSDEDDVAAICDDIAVAVRSAIVACRTARIDMWIDDDSETFELKVRKSR